MNKKIIYGFMFILMMTVVMGLSVTRQLPSTSSPNSNFNVIYNTIGDSSKWAVPIEDTITGGCTPTSVRTVIMHDIGEATTLTKTYTFTSPSSGSCTFTGFWTDLANTKHNFDNGVVTIGTPSGTCSGSSTQSCMINFNTNECAGTQTRTCSNGVWSSWGICTKTDSNCGSPTTCSGSSTQSCSVGDCAGVQTRTCNSGTWSGWGTCQKNDANCGSPTPTSTNWGKCIIGNYTSTKTDFTSAISDFGCLNLTHLILISALLIVVLLLKK